MRRLAAAPRLGCGARRRAATTPRRRQPARRKKRRRPAAARRRRAGRARPCPRARAAIRASDCERRSRRPAHGHAGTLGIGAARPRAPVRRRARRPRLRPHAARARPAASAGCASAPARVPSSRARPAARTVGTARRGCAGDAGRAAPRRARASCLPTLRRVPAMRARRSGGLRRVRAGEARGRHGSTAAVRPPRGVFAAARRAGTRTVVTGAADRAPAGACTADDTAPRARRALIRAGRARGRRVGERVELRRARCRPRRSARSRRAS